MHIDLIELIILIKYYKYSLFLTNNTIQITKNKLFKIKTQIK